MYLDEPTQAILSKGLNFAVTQKTLLLKEVICGIEMALAELPGGEAEEVQSEVCRLMKTVGLPKPNIMKAECNTLYCLRKDDTLVIFKS